MNMGGVHLQLLTALLIGVSLSEPHIRRRYICINNYSTAIIMLMQGTLSNLAVEFPSSRDSYARISS